MTKAELVEALELYFEDDEVVVCAHEHDGGWDNITCVGRINDTGTATIYFGGGSPFKSDR